MSDASNCSELSCRVLEKVQSLGLSPGLESEWLGSLYRCCLLSLLCKEFALQPCLTAGSDCQLQNPAWFGLNIQQIESLLEKAPTLQGRRAEDTAGHVSDFYEVPKRLSAGTSSQAPPRSHLAPASTLPTPCPTVGIFGKALFLLDSF